MNSNFDEVDNLFIEYFNNYQEVPDLITNGISCAINRKNKQFKIVLLIKKIIITIASLLALTGGVVFASVIINNIFSYNRGIEQAVENNYIQNIEMDYIETDNLKFKVSSFVMDDINFSLVFDFKVPDNVENYQGIALHNLKINDNFGNQLLYDTEGDEFYKNKSLIHSSWEIIEKKDHDIRQILKAYSKEFPKSNTISINFNGITLFNIDNGESKTKTYNGNWNLSFNIEEQLNDRNIEYYTNESNSNIQELKVSNTGSVLKIKSEKYLDNIQLFDDRQNAYNIVNVTQNRDENLKRYIENEWIIFFDLNTYDKVNSLNLKIDGISYPLNRIN